MVKFNIPEEKKVRVILDTDAKNVVEFNNEWTSRLDIVTYSVEIEKCGSDMEGEGLERGENGDGCGEWQDVKIRYRLEEQGEPLGEYEFRIQRKEYTR